MKSKICQFAGCAASSGRRDFCLPHYGIGMRQRAEWRAINGMVWSARRFIEDRDFKHGVNSALVFSATNQKATDGALRLIIERMVVGRECDHLLIPRRAATEFIKSVGGG